MKPELWAGVVVEQDDLIAFCNIFRHFQVQGIQSEAFII